jgi:hypothetical protein
MILEMTLIRILDEVARIHAAANFITSGNDHGLPKCHRIGTVGAFMLNLLPAVLAPIVPDV